LVAAIGVVGSLIETRSHVGTTRDSNQYVGTAANLRDGKGLTMPFNRPSGPLDPRRGIERYGRIPYTDEPPLYPLAIAAVRSVTPSYSAAARAVGALSFGLAFLFVGVMGWYASANILIAIATQAAVLLGPVHPFPFAPRWSWLSLSG